MPTTTLDLWPNDIAVSDEITPVSILREQASLLGQKTKNLVQGKVELLSGKGGTFLYGFYLVAPALDHYKYRLLSIQYPIEHYPVTINFEAGNRVLTANDYNEFVAKLGDVLVDEKTRSIVRSLVSQSQS